MFLDNLRLYLTHFAGERCSRIMVSGPASGSLDEAWAELAAGLGLPDADEGERVAAAAGAPALAGDVEQVLDGAHHRGLMLRTDEPAPGVALVFVNRWRENSYANLSAYLFGDEAAVVAARDEPRWQAVLAQA